MPINERGYFQPLNLPPVDLCWPELRPLVEEYTTLRNKLRSAESRLGVLEGEQRTAEHQDNLAHAKAIREGKPDPGNKNVEKLIADRKQTRRVVEATKEALAAVENDLAEVFDDTYDEQLDAAAETIADALATYEAQIAAVAASRNRLVAAVAMRNFLEGFSQDPEGKGYLPHEWPLWKLVAKHGETAGAFEQVIDALLFDRTVIEQPEQVKRLFNLIPGPLASVQPGVAEFTRSPGEDPVLAVQMT